MNPSLQNIHKRAAAARNQITNVVADACASYEDGLTAILHNQVLQLQYFARLESGNQQERSEAAIIILGLRLYTDELLTALHKKFPCKQSGEPSSAGPSSAAPASTSTGAPPTSPAPNESAPTSGPA